jgi:hypothetical protein
MKTIKMTSQRMVALATLGVMTAGTLGSMGVAQASSKSKRNLALGLGAVTAYGLIKKNKTIAIAGGLGTAYAYSKYRKAKKQEKAQGRRSQQWYKNRYGSNWRNHYVRGY